MDPTPRKAEQARRPADHCWPVPTGPASLTDVSLPFLAADSGHDEYAADAALPHQVKDGWVRPYRPGPWRVAAAAMLLMLASYLLIAAVIMGFAGNGSGVVTTVSAAVLAVGCTLRLLRPLLTDHNADFLGRTEAFDQAADAIESRAARAAAR